MARKYRVPQKPREGTIRALVFSQLRQKRKDETIIALVKKKFPDSKFNENPAGHLAVYKTHFRYEKAA